MNRPPSMFMFLPLNQTKPNRITQKHPETTPQSGSGASLAHLDACISETAVSSLSSLPIRIRHELSALPPRVCDGMVRRTPSSIVQAAVRFMAGAALKSGSLPVSRKVRGGGGFI
jgi:hypothetical protein